MTFRDTLPGDQNPSVPCPGCSRTVSADMLRDHRGVSWGPDWQCDACDARAIADGRITATALSAARSDVLEEL